VGLIGGNLGGGFSGVALMLLRLFTFAIAVYCFTNPMMLFGLLELSQKHLRQTQTQLGRVLIKLIANPN